MVARVAALRASLLEGRRLVGLFTRSNDPHVMEALADSPLDFVVLDVEHGSLGREDVDRLVFAGLAGDLPVIVRVPDATPAAIQHAVTVGASGVVVPHVASGEQAAELAQFARNAAIERAYAGAGRPSAHRRRAWRDFQADLRERFVVIAQVDEPAGASAAEAIARADGIDAVFMGTLSIALAMGADGPAAAEVEEAMGRICAACRAAGRRVGMHLRDPGAEPRWSALGVSLYVVGNDYGLLLDGAEQAVSRFMDLRPGR